MLGLEGVDSGEIRETALDVPEAQQRHPALGKRADELPRVPQLLAAGHSSLGEVEGGPKPIGNPLGRGHAEEDVEPAGGVLVRRHEACRLVGHVARRGFLAHPVVDPAQRHPDLDSGLQGACGVHPGNPVNEQHHRPCAPRPTSRGRMPPG